MIKKLTDLRESEFGEIFNFTNDVIKLKILSMGIVPGSLFSISKISNNGVCLKINTYKVALRYNEANTILVKKTFN